MKSIKVTLGTGLLTAISLYSNAANNSSKPNIIFILCDDMGYGDLGCYGQRKVCCLPKLMPVVRLVHLPVLL